MERKRATKVIQLYTHDSVLVGYITAVGRSEITDLLQGIFAQGWTGIKVRAVNARRVGDVILVANEYTAIGSGTKAGETLGGKSSHVLINVDGEWLSTMHTAV